MKTLAYVLIFIFGFAEAQELNCDIVINTQKLNNPNQQVFKDLENSLKDFVNKINWTGQKYEARQKISCTMMIQLETYGADNFTGSIQVQSFRTVFNSTYTSPVFNYNDLDFAFSYLPNQNMIFNQGTFDSNLISVIAFYCNLIIGLDNESFVYKSGSKSFGVAQEISDNAQQSGYVGWTQTDNNNSRYLLIKSLTNSQIRATRKAMSEYHEGLDIMTMNLQMAKEKIKDALISMDKANTASYSPMLMRMFFDAKSEEIASIFSGGPNVDVRLLKESLNNMAPNKAQEWQKIK